MAERGSGLRIPLWVFLIILIVIVAIAYFALGASAQAGLEAAGAVAALVPTPPGHP